MRIISSACFSYPIDTVDIIDTANTMESDDEVNVAKKSMLVSQSDGTCAVTAIFLRKLI